MATQQKAAKPNYQATLQRRAEELHEILGNTADPAQQLVSIQECLKETALESWKNGIEAGKRRAQPKGSRPAKTA